MPDDKKTCTLSELIDVLAAAGVTARVLGDAGCRIEGMAIDSREVSAGNLFVCKGAGFTPAFLAGAVRAGAAAYMCEGVGEQPVRVQGRRLHACVSCRRRVRRRRRLYVRGRGGAAERPFRPGGGRHRHPGARGIRCAPRHGARGPGGLRPSGGRPARGGNHGHQGQIHRRVHVAVDPDGRGPRALHLGAEDGLHVVGITGTKGKSTVAYMLRSILTAAGREPSILGSIDTDDGVVRYESHNTTPEAPDVWRHLRNTVDAGRGAMVMEVSSQGLKYDRVLGLPFELGCFLNIGRDHISGVEHPDFEDYFASKLRIFNQCEVAVVNLRTDHVERVLDAAKAAPCVATFAVESRGTGEDALPIEPLFAASDVAQLVTGGLSFTVRERTATGGIACEERVELGMPGLFNVDNALAAVAMARLLGVGYDAIRSGLAKIRVPGRMELVSSSDGHVLAIVDYAHNELSFETLFKSVKAEYPDRRVIALFGAPGGKASSPSRRSSNRSRPSTPTVA